MSQVFVRPLLQPQVPSNSQWPCTEMKELYVGQAGQRVAVKEQRFSILNLESVYRNLVVHLFSNREKTIRLTISELNAIPKPSHPSSRDD